MMERKQKWLLGGGVAAAVLGGLMLMAGPSSLTGGVGMMGGAMMGSGTHGGMMGRGMMGGMHAGMMGGGGGTDQVPEVTPRGNAPAASAEVSIQEWRMEPGSLKLPAGQRVVLTVRNKGTMPHDFAIPGLGVRLVNIAPGGSKQVEIDTGKAGTYDFLCDLPGHAQLGQKGTITVEG